MGKKFQKFVTWTAGFLFLLVLPGSLRADAPVQAASADLNARFQELQSQIAALQNQLAQQNKKHETEIEELRRQIEIKGPEKTSEGKAVYIPPAGAGQMPKWLEGLEMGGDFRLRYEAFDQNEVTRDRNRFRYRLRWKVVKHVTENLDLGFRFITGSTTDPTSPMQTLTGDFTFKNIFIDEAYAKYRPAFLKEYIPHLDKVEIGGGKTENPFYETSTSMVWDPDVRPEGVYETLVFGFFDGKLKPFVNLGQFILQENATVADAELFGFQTGMKWNPPGLPKTAEVKVTNALAYYDFSDFTRDSNFTTGGTSLAGGNTTLGSTNLAAGDFNVLQVYNDIQFRVRNLPVKVFGDFATNLHDQTPDPDNRNVGYEYGLQLGQAKKKGDWEALYYYAYIEPNAVVGAFNESDLGVGHANKRGSVVKLGYKLTDYLKLGFGGYFVNNVTGADDETRRFQTDIDWVF